MNIGSCLVIRKIPVKARVQLFAQIPVETRVKLLQKYLPMLKFSYSTGYASCLLIHVRKIHIKLFAKIPVSTCV